MYTEVFIEEKRIVTHAIDLLKDGDTVYTWLTPYHTRYGNAGAYWEKIREYMDSAKPSLQFNIEDHINVDLTRDDKPVCITRMLNNMGSKIKFKKHSNLVPWISELQTYLLDTNWSKKKPFKDTVRAAETEDEFLTWVRRNTSFVAPTPRTNRRTGRIIPSTTIVSTTSGTMASDTWSYTQPSSGTSIPPLE